MLICQSCDNRTDQVTRIWNPFWVLAKEGPLRVCSKYKKWYSQKGLLFCDEAQDLFNQASNFINYDNSNFKQRVIDSINSGKIVFGDIFQLGTLQCKIIVLQPDEKLRIIGCYSSCEFPKTERVIELLSKVIGEKLCL